MQSSRTLIPIRLRDGEFVEIETSAPLGMGTRLEPAAQGHIEALVVSFDQAIQRIRTLSGMLFDGLADLPKSPDALAIELGIKFGGKVGVIVTEGMAEANLKLTISWKSG